MSEGMATITAAGSIQADTQWDSGEVTRAFAAVHAAVAAADPVAIAEACKAARILITPAAEESSSVRVLWVSQMPYLGGVLRDMGWFRKASADIGALYQMAGGMDGAPLALKRYLKLYSAANSAMMSVDAVLLVSVLDSILRVVHACPWTLLAKQAKTAAALALVLGDVRIALAVRTDIPAAAHAELLASYTTGVERICMQCISPLALAGVLPSLTMPSTLTAVAPVVSALIRRMPEYVLAAAHLAGLWVYEGVRLMSPTPDQYPSAQCKEVLEQFLRTEDKVFSAGALLIGPSGALQSHIATSMVAASVAEQIDTPLIATGMVPMLVAVYGDDAGDYFARLLHALCEACVAGEDGAADSFESVLAQWLATPPRVRKPRVGRDVVHAALTTIVRATKCDGDTALAIMHEMFDVAE